MLLSVLHCPLEVQRDILLKQRCCRTREYSRSRRRRFGYFGYRTASNRFMEPHANFFRSISSFLSHVKYSYGFI